MVARVNRSFATSEVPGTRFADVRWVAETGSTNQDLLAAAAEGAPEGVVLVADHQTAGRGRLDRSWIAPAGASLLVSALLRPSVGPEDLFLLTLACGLAAVNAVDEVAGVRPGLKWPNDLVVAAGPLADRKLAGILAVQKRAGFLDEVRAVSATLGRDVRVESTTTAFEGQAVAIADDGRLLVECDGEVVAVTVGDIVHARLMG